LPLDDAVFPGVPGARGESPEAAPMFGVEVMRTGLP